MRRPMMRRNELPDFCLSTIPSTGQLIILKKGVRGYYASGWDTGNREENQNIAQEHNRRRGISDIQEAAMSAGSMFGWNLPGADPQWYLDNARYVNTIMAKGHIKDPVMSIYYPVDDFLLRYEVLGEAKMYLSVSALPKELLGVKSQFVMQPDLICGVPAMPVKAHRRHRTAATPWSWKDAAMSLVRSSMRTIRSRRGYVSGILSLFWVNIRKRPPRLLPGSVTARMTGMARPITFGAIMAQGVHP